MLVVTKNGEFVEINRKDFLNDTDYYTKILSVKFGKNTTDTHYITSTVNKNNLVSIIKRTTYK